MTRVNQMNYFKFAPGDQVKVAGRGYAVVLASADRNNLIKVRCEGSAEDEMIHPSKMRMA